ncbi:MAG: glycoside hydrolase [Ectothiorhodospiraceae bacterium]|nr:glycoside hydrolase [Ectothiorhodospiraceae bacterium]
MQNNTTPANPVPNRLKVVLCWHMHQPQYQQRPNGEYQLPWTYLHAIKDYTDMAAHLEADPRARAVVNFAPTLLEQLDDYRKQVAAFLANGQAIGDPLLAALAEPVLPVDSGASLALIGNCLRAHETRLIQRFAPFARLADIARSFLAHPDTAFYLSEQFLVDLLMWYHLAWLGEFVRRDDARIKYLIKKGSGFSLHDRRQLLIVIGELLNGVIGRYRRLAETGQIELSVSPYAHPIVPLLLDLESAKEAMPEVSLPNLSHYPGGEERVRWHLKAAIETFEHFFGFKPKGCWPSEGGISTASLSFYEQAGFHWVASGENVLRNTLALEDESDSAAVEHCRHLRYYVKGSEIACFFRDDGLSDLIGFTYSDWHADDAIANFIGHLENIANNCQGVDDAVVSIILDGENAWEHYPENGYYFLEALYRGLAEHPSLELSTFTDCLNSSPSVTPSLSSAGAFTLQSLVAGSWVYGSFSTWIGDADKNRAWDMLGDAKHCFDAVVSRKTLTELQQTIAEKQLGICEGSDWFWWFGDYNPAESVSDFEHLFRQQLTTLYQMLGEEPPEYLSHVFARGGGEPQQGGVMRRGSS